MEISWRSSALHLMERGETVITLFHHPKSRSTRFIFLLEELKVPYEAFRKRVAGRHEASRRSRCVPLPIYVTGLPLSCVSRDTRS